MLFVVCYDIADNERRNRVATIAKDYGVRVQKSIFECDMDNEKCEEMEKRIAGVINEAEDSVRIYENCSECHGKLKILGSGEFIEEQEVYVI